MKNDQMLIAGAIVFKDYRRRRLFFLTKGKKEEGWKIPKVIVRKGESSVRAAIRMANEQAGMSARVLEEAGRTSASAIVNGKTVSQNFYYYLMLRESAGEVIGFEEFIWLEYAKALKQLSSKSERDMLRQASKVLRTWEKTHQVKNY